MNYLNDSVLGSLMTAAGMCLLLWLPVVTTRSHLKRVSFHLVAGTLAMLALATQYTFLSAAALVVMLAVSDVLFAVLVFLEQRHFQSMHGADFKAARFLPSSFLAH